MTIMNQYEFFKKVKLTDEGHLVFDLNDDSILNIEETIKNLLDKYNTPNYIIDKSYVSIDGNENIKIIEVEQIAHYIKDYAKHRVKERIIPKVVIKLVKKKRKSKRQIYLNHKEQEKRYLNKICELNKTKLIK